MALAELPPRGSGMHERVVRRDHALKAKQDSFATLIFQPRNNDASLHLSENTVLLSYENDVSYRITCMIKNMAIYAFSTQNIS